MTKGHDRGRASIVPLTKPALKTKNHHFTKLPSIQTEGPALICKDINDFLQPESQAYQALIVHRSQNHWHIQEKVDELADWGRFSADDESGRVEVEGAFDLTKKAQDLARSAVQAGFPNCLGSQIEQDFQKIATVLMKLVPTFKQVSLTLHICGTNSCNRWHRDHYVGRGVVTYNSCGTQYVDHQGKLQAGVIPAESEILSANVGDILFIKGVRFPDSPNGLVHRSPPVLYHEDGSVVNRLLLKVDVD